MEAAYGANNQDAPLPLSATPMKTNQMHTYLDKELIERLGLENEIFESGSFTFRSEE